VTRAGLLLAVALVACEAPLDPIAPSDRVFSLSGYLDASADTQWVRVEPFGTVADPVPGAIDAAVTLVTPDGARVAMTQTVRTFETGPAHLFWTVEPLVAGATYRVEAERSDGALARATVRIPEAESVALTLIDGLVNCPTLVIVEGAERLADVRARYELLGPDRQGEVYEFSKRPSLAQTASGAYTAQVFFGEDATEMEINPFPGVEPIAPEVVVAVATDDWPEVDGLTLEEALASADFDRVEGGVGFVGGIVTTTADFVPGYGFIPFELDPRPPEPCFP
jgi:hypothetical protein